MKSILVLPKAKLTPELQEKAKELLKLIKKHPKKSLAVSALGIYGTLLAKEAITNPDKITLEEKSEKDTLEFSDKTTSGEIHNQISKLITGGKITKAMIQAMIDAYSNTSKTDTNWRQINEVVANMLEIYPITKTNSQDFARKFQEAIGHVDGKTKTGHIDKASRDGKIGPKTLKSLLENWDTLKK